MSNGSPRRLQKSRTQRVFFGVAGGLAEYLEVDAVIARVVFIIMCFIGGLGLVAYIALALFMPEAAGSSSTEPSGKSGDEGSLSSSSAQRNRNIVGIILIGIGTVFLFQQLGLLTWMDWGTTWAIIIILIGAALIAGRLRR